MLYLALLPTSTPAPAARMLQELGADLKQENCDYVAGQIPGMTLGNKPFAQSSDAECAYWAPYLLVQQFGAYKEAPYNCNIQFQSPTTCDAFIPAVDAACSAAVSCLAGEDPSPSPPSTSPPPSSTSTSMKSATCQRTPRPPACADPLSPSLACS